MTFMEKLKQEHPEAVDKCFLDGADGCPYDYGYEKEDDKPCENKSFSCKDCWNREMPEAKPASKNSSRLDILKLSSKAYLHIGRIEGVVYRLLEPEAQNSLQDDINALANIVGELVEYVKEDQK